mgnify:CR=1 FL=1
MWWDPKALYNASFLSFFYIQGRIQGEGTPWLHLTQKFKKEMKGKRETDGKSDLTSAHPPPNQTSEYAPVLSHNI